MKQIHTIVFDRLQTNNGLFCQYYAYRKVNSRLLILSQLLPTMIVRGFDFTNNIMRKFCAKLNTDNSSPKR